MIRRSLFDTLFLGYKSFEPAHSQTDRWMIGFDLQYKSVGVATCKRAKQSPLVDSVAAMASILEPRNNAHDNATTQCHYQVAETEGQLSRGPE